MKYHALKTWPVFFQDTLDGKKAFEYREDKGFSVGDFLVLREWVPGTRSYTGRVCLVCIVYILREFVPSGFCVLGISREVNAGIEK